MTRTRFRMLVVVLLALCVVGFVHTSASSPPAIPRHGATSSVPTPDNPDATDATDATDAPVVRAEGQASPAPIRVRIPRIGVDSGLERLTTGKGGRLRAPSAWQRAGWFADGTRPGDLGPAVIAGHIDSPTGPAVFARLSELRTGDRVVVEQAGGASVAFRVERTEVVSKKSFPTRAVYGPTPDAQLRLITCDGPYVESAGGYQDNLVVYASEVRG